MREHNSAFIPASASTTNIGLASTMHNILPAAQAAACSPEYPTGHRAHRYAGLYPIGGVDQPHQTATHTTAADLQPGRCAFVCEIIHTFATCALLKAHPHADLRRFSLHDNDAVTPFPPPPVQLSLRLPPPPQGRSQPHPWPDWSQAPHFRSALKARPGLRRPAHVACGRICMPTVPSRCRHTFLQHYAGHSIRDPIFPTAHQPPHHPAAAAELPGMGQARSACRTHTHIMFQNQCNLKAPLPDPCSHHARRLRAVPAVKRHPQWYRGRSSDHSRSTASDHCSPRAGSRIPHQPPPCPATQ